MQVTYSPKTGQGNKVDGTPRHVVKKARHDHKHVKTAIGFLKQRWIWKLIKGEKAGPQLTSECGAHANHIVLWRKEVLKTSHACSNRFLDLIVDGHQPHYKDLATLLWYHAALNSEFSSSHQIVYRLFHTPVVLFPQ